VGELSTNRTVSSVVFTADIFAFPCVNAVTNGLIPLVSRRISRFAGEDHAFELVCNLEVGRAKSVSLTTKSLFFFPQPPLDAFVRLGREALFVFVVPMRSGTEKADLLSIAPTPLAENQMNAQADALPPPKRVIQRLRLQSRRLAATGGKLRHPSPEGFQHVSQPVHYNLTECAPANEVSPR
jgi:hypothetical protein